MLRDGLRDGCSTCGRGVASRPPGLRPTSSQLLDFCEFSAGSAPSYRDEVIAALERCEVRLASSGEAGRVAVLNLMRARTRRFEVVFVLGPRGRSRYLAVRARRRSSTTTERRPARRKAGAPRPGVARPLPLLHGVHTPRVRRLYLVREAATDEGTPREPSPFWEEVAARLRPATTSSTRRPEGRSRRSRGRSTTRRRSARAASRAYHAARRHRTPDQAIVLADANGWERRLARARGALRRETRLAQRGTACRFTEPKSVFGGTELSSGLPTARRHRSCDPGLHRERGGRCRGRSRCSPAWAGRRRVPCRWLPGAAWPRSCGCRSPFDAGLVKPAVGFLAPLARRCAARGRPPRAHRAADGGARRGAVARPRRVRTRRGRLAAPARAEHSSR